MKINLFFFISDFNFGGASNSIFNFLNNLDSKKFRLFMIFVEKSDYKNLLPKKINVINIKKDNKNFSTIRSFFKIKKIIINKTKKKSKKCIYIKYSLCKYNFNFFFKQNFKIKISCF